MAGAWFRVCDLDAIAGACAYQRSSERYFVRGSMAGRTDRGRSVFQWEGGVRRGIALGRKTPAHRVKSRGGVVVLGNGKIIQNRKTRQPGI